MNRSDTLCQCHAHLHEHGDASSREVPQYPDVQCGTEVVNVGHKHVLVALADETVEYSRPRHRGEEVPMS